MKRTSSAFCPGKTRPLPVSQVRRVFDVKPVYRVRINGNKSFFVGQFVGLNHLLQIGAGLRHTMHHEDHRHWFFGVVTGRHMYCKSAVRVQDFYFLRIVAGFAYGHGFEGAMQ